MSVIWLQQALVLLAFPSGLLIADLRVTSMLNANENIQFQPKALLCALTAKGVSTLKRPTALQTAALSLCSGSWMLGIFAPYKVKLTPRHSISGSHVMAEQTRNATYMLLTWEALGHSEIAEHGWMPEEIPETAGRGTVLHLLTVMQSIHATYGFAFPVPNH